MLVALSIRNIVLIDRLDLEPGEGFTALSGETGAGKSILLDALNLALGAPAARRLIRTGAEQAMVTACFALKAGHPVWALLADAGIDADADEEVSLKRVLRRDGPARALVNDQPVTAALLARIGAALVEQHGQHAAAALLASGAQRDLLDQYAGTGALLADCRQAWERLLAARETREALETASADRAHAREALEAACEELAVLSAAPGEAARLAEQRAALMQADRVAACLAEAETALGEGDVAGLLARAARALETIARLPGFDTAESTLGAPARAAGEALERALIEVQEGEAQLQTLSSAAQADPAELERIEARLFAIRAAARKHEVEPDALGERLAALEADLAAIESDDETLTRAGAEEREALARWHGAADRLSAARRAAAGRLEDRLARELKPLKLGRLQFRVRLEPLEEGASGARGAERVEFEVETVAGAGFGPLKAIASGGELARLSLALKCAAAGTGSAPILIFDEVDQGVGGAVAAAVGERLARLGEARQVLAITHSPQVAAAADAQWAIVRTRPQEGLGATSVSGLDDGAREEEIARMLAGAAITPEARAAARRLLEERCRKTPPSRR